MFFCIMSSVRVCLFTMLHVDIHHSAMSKAHFARCDLLFAVFFIMTKIRKKQKSMENLIFIIKEAIQLH